MKIIIERNYKKPGYIIGNLSVKYSWGDEEYTHWLCNTLEPPEGTATETVTAGSKKAIASGTYDVALCWSPRFKRRMPYLVGVPGRSAIMIHPGNYPRDSVGCILVGSNTKKGMLTDSKKTTDMLIDLIYQAIVDEEEVKVVII